MLFSFVIENVFALRFVHAETNQMELINEEYLTLHYSSEAKNDTVLWQITFKRQSEYEKFDQRLKVKITDEKNQVIEYPIVEELAQQGDWLVEKNFSQTMEGQVAFELPKTTEKLQLSVQMDQKEAGKENASINADILAIKQPFDLVVKTAAKQAKAAKTTETKETETKKKAEAVTVDSAEFIGPKINSQSLPPLQRASTANKYINMDPIYTNDASGTYPTNSWQPTGQTNVINHRGGSDKNRSWDTIGSWSGATNDYSTSYIHYGAGESRTADLSLRKYATETNAPGVFDVRLNVRGNSITKPGIDVFFVLDNSGSMDSSNLGGTKRKTVAVESLTEILTLFKTAVSGLPANSNYIRIGGTYFGSSVMGTHSLSSETTDWDNMLNGYKNKSAYDQNTYIQGGLIKAQEELQKDKPERRKVVFLLTDGAPNLSRYPAKGKVDSSIYYDKIRVTGYNDSKHPGNNYYQGHYLDSETYPGKTVYLRDLYNVDRPVSIDNIDSPGSKLKIRSHLVTTNSQAADIREQGIEIQTVAIGTFKTPYEVHTEAELVEGLYRMATQRAGTLGDKKEDYYFYNVQDKTSLETSLRTWFDSALSTAEDGTLEDPLGDMVELVEGSLKIEDVSLKNGLGTTVIRSDKMAKVSTDTAKRVIKVSDINLYKNQEIEVTYKVRLKSEAVAGRWYQANKPTRFTPTPNRSADILDFGVPSVRLSSPKFDIPVEKIWQNDDQNLWGLRSGQVQVVLQKKSGSSWVNVATKVLSDSKGWKDTFTAVEGGSNSYRVAEVSRITGYAPPTYNYTSEFTAANIPNGGIIITNTLLKGSISFHKYKEDKTTPFTGSDKPVFSVIGADGKTLIKDLTPDDSGKVTITGIPKGDYTLKETHTPAGYLEGQTWPIRVTELPNGSGVTITINGQSSDITIINERKKDFIIPVEKIWEDQTNKWGKRPTEIEVKLQGKNNGNWTDLQTLKLTSSGNWKGTFNAVDGDESKTYRVVESTRVEDYGTPVVSIEEFNKEKLGSSTVKVTNKLLLGSVSFDKFAGKTGFPFVGENLPEFTVTRKSDGKLLVAGVKPDTKGKVTISDIPFGDFTIVESHVPKGFTGIGSISLKAVENEKGDGLIITMNGQESLEVVNELEPFALTINKIDQDGAALKGAKFKLVWPDEVFSGPYEQIAEGVGPTFLFDYLLPGEYILMEEKTPEGYYGLEKPFRFTLQPDGVVTFEDHPNVKGSSELGGMNAISLTVTNKKDRPGVLPYTGGLTTQLFFKLAVGLMATAGLLAVVYWFYDRRRS